MMITGPVHDVLPKGARARARMYSAGHREVLGLALAGTGPGEAWAVQVPST